MTSRLPLRYSIRKGTKERNNRRQPSREKERAEREYRLRIATE